VDFCFLIVDWFVPCLNPQKDRNTRSKAIHFVGERMEFGALAQFDGF
jgi:hypothetical protein